MPARPRGLARGSFRRIPSTIRKMEKRKKGKTPPPTRPSTRIHSSPLRRSRSPRSRTRAESRSKPKRRSSSSPIKNNARKSRESLRPSPKRTQSESSKIRERTPEKKFGEKLPYEDPDKDQQRPSYTKEMLKNMIFRIPGFFEDKFRDGKYDPNITINRTFDPERVTIVRQLGEGSVPICDRIFKCERKFDDYDSEPSHSDRLQFESSSSYDGVRGGAVRQFLASKKERSLHHSRRPLRDEYDYRDERPRDDLRYQQPSTSTRRSRSFDRSTPPEKKERFVERDVSRGPRRSLDRSRERDRDRDRERDRERDRNRGRSADRLIRSQPSPSPRRHIEQYRDYEERRPRSLDRRPRSLERRARSLEKRDSELHHFRDSEYSSRERFSNADHSIKGRVYYDAEERENPSPSRGRGGFHSRARGGALSGRTFIPSSFIPPGPPLRPLRGMPLARGPTIGRRLAFPARKSFRGSMQGRL